MFAPHAFPGVKPGEYDEKTHGEVLVIVQIESRPGVENVEKIAAVEGLDVLFIGEPTELGVCMTISDEIHTQDHLTLLSRCALLVVAKSMRLLSSVF